MKLTPEQKIISDLEINIDQGDNIELIKKLGDLLFLLQHAEIGEAYKLNKSITAAMITGIYKENEIDLEMHEDIWELTIKLY